MFKSDFTSYKDDSGIKAIDYVVEELGKYMKSYFKIKLSFKFKKEIRLDFYFGRQRTQAGT